MLTGILKYARLLPAAILLLNACAYHKPLAQPKPIYQPSQTDPHFALLVQQPNHPRLFFECLSPCCLAYLPFEITVQEPAANLLAQGLNAKGIPALLQDSPSQALPQYSAQIEFFPQFTDEQNCKRKPRFFNTGAFMPFNAVLRVTIRHRPSGEITAQYQEALPVTPHFSFYARTLSFLAPFTLGALTPMQLQSMGKTLSTQLKDALQELLPKIIGYIQEDNLAFTAPCSALEEAPLTTAGRYRHLLRSVAEIQNPHGGEKGSAFFITANGYLLTAASLVKGTDYVLLTLPGEKQPRRAQVAARNTARNAALLKAEGNAYRPLALEKQNPHLFKGEKVVSLGVGNTPVTQGVLSGIARINGTRYLLADTAFVTQHIGGPLVAGESGRVLGVNTSTLEPGLTQAVSVFELEKLFPQIIKEISTTGRI